MNDGQGGDVYAEIDTLAIRDKPHYLAHSTAQATVVGDHYYFKVAALNTNGIVYSEAAGFTLGEKPPTPPDAPTSIASVTSSSVIGISVNVVTIDLNIVPILLSYSIEIDDGIGGDFTPIFGDVADTLSTTATYFGAVQSRVYRVRYRVKNAVGWSDYSVMGYIRAADVPDAPPAPIVTNVSSTQITVALLPTTERNGAEIEGYELWIDDG